ncbi:MAG: hypothetical protein IPH31_08660 [Lewinellaceae bacterium]|nr:hypothetical protein [Lewinellaceae bacterium]
MKQISTLFLLLLTCYLNAQTIFVKANASGSNNGSSWANAYTSLDAALAAAVPGQAIWVASGTYKPSFPAPDNSFALQSGVELYGGFAGTETQLSQRNPTLNVTTLSGDIAGNDIAGNFDLNRTDNVQHILIAFFNTSTAKAVVDGFVFRGGHTLVDDPNPPLSRQGGGILAGTKLTVRNCNFINNFGENGAALAALGADSDGIIVDNCLFEANKATEQGILLLLQTPTGEVNNCIFRKNLTNRGALYPLETTAITIDSCLFESNNGGANFGAAMFSWQASWTMTNSIFRKNKSANAAGIYIDGRVGGDVATIDNCLFERDTATDFGGAGIYGWQATLVLKNTTFRDNHAPNAAGMYVQGREFDSELIIDSCLFERNIGTAYGATSIYNNGTNYTLSNSIFRENVAPSSGAAIYNSDSTIFTVTNCLFEANTGAYASAVANYGLDCNGTFESCTFHNNRATQGGAALSNGFEADVLYRNCTFTNNEASFGGAIFTQNDGTRLSIENCFFSQNTASGNAGCIYINPNIPTSIRNSTFTFNTANFGGVLEANGDSMLVIENTIFIDNLGGMQGAALNLNDTKSVLTNCLFARNLNLGAGAGGGISINSSDSLFSTVKAVNCTFAENIATIGAGIAQWEAPLGNASLSLLNCLFHNPGGDNYGIEQGAPSVSSLNGNQSGDATLEDYLTDSKDVHNLPTTFFDPINDDFRLTMGPAVDGGVAEGAPTTDLLGNPRQGLPDRGCYELGINSVKNVGFQVLAMTCSPNPASDRTTLSLQNDLNGTAEIVVWNQAGQRVGTFTAEKSGSAFLFPLELRDWPAGIYRVQCRMGTLMHEGSFVKI